MNPNCGIKKAWHGRRVKILELDRDYGKVWTGDYGRLLEIDAKSGYVIIEDMNGNMVRLPYKLVKLL